MCIGAISSNLFPFDSKPTNIVATSSLVVAVAAGILVGVAYALHWGMPAIYSLSALCAVTLIIPLTIIFCKKTPRVQRAPERSIPVPSGQFPSAIPSVPREHKGPKEQGSYELYTLVKKNDLETFKKAICPYDRDTLWDILTGFTEDFGLVELDPDDTATVVEKDLKQISLIHVILNQQSESKKIAFLSAIFENQDDHSVNKFQSNQHFAHPKFLEIQSQETIELLLTKLDVTTTKVLFEISIRGESNLIWVQAFFARWEQDPELRKGFSEYAIPNLCRDLIDSKLNKNLKEKYLMVICSHNQSVIEKVEFQSSLHRGDWSHWTTYFHRLEYLSKWNLLHWAIILANSEGVDGQDMRFVRALASTSLIEKAGESQGRHVTPLFLALISGNTLVVQILLNAKADPNATFETKNNCFAYSRTGSSRVTPLMIAARMGRQEIVEALLKAGADPKIKDGDDLKAWTMENYAEEFKNDKVYWKPLYPAKEKE